MTDLSKKELVSNLYDAFADKVAAQDKELKELHAYLTPAEQHENLVIDITAAVKEAGWKVSPGILDALCHGGAELMTMDLSEEAIIPPLAPAADPNKEPDLSHQDGDPQPGPSGVEPGKAPGDVPDAAASADQAQSESANQGASGAALEGAKDEADKN